MAACEVLPTRGADGAQSRRCWLVGTANLHLLLLDGATLCTEALARISAMPAGASQQSTLTSLAVSAMGTVAVGFADGSVATFVLADIFGAHS